MFVSCACEKGHRQAVLVARPDVLLVRRDPRRRRGAAAFRRDEHQDLAPRAGFNLRQTLSRTLDVRVLPAFSTEPANVFFVYPAQRFLTVNVRAFMELARAGT